METIFEIPNGLVGTLIGVGGSTIIEIQTLSGAAIKISKESGEGDTRQVMLSGTEEQIESAKTMIRVKLNL
jgi:polyribonucleotide nucleotidyltransferase